ncbi:MAG: ABC transporter permease, partial [Thioalkalivibrio sp.]|nr:ABC transporter permease [Thioalkalivibrio sp.]
MEATRAPVASTLRGDAGAGADRKKVGGRAVLVTAQMALSTALLFGAALFVRSLQAATDVDVGFSARDGGLVRVEADPNVHDAERRRALVAEVTRRLEADARVTSVAATSRMPLALGTVNTSFAVPGVEPPPDQSLHVLEVAQVSPDYFSTLGISFREGRAFERGEGEADAGVVILSQAAADRYWPGESAVGRVLHRGGDPDDPLTVVGVADNVKIWSLGEAPRPYMYLPYRGGYTGEFEVVARGPVPAGELAAIVRDEVRTLDADLFLAEVSTLEDHLGYVYFLPRMAATLLSLIGGLALILACMGLYGMVSYGVSCRTREMGIR